MKVLQLYLALATIASLFDLAVGTKRKLIEHDHLSNVKWLHRSRRSAINVTALQTVKSMEECGADVRNKACRLLEAHNVGYVWLWPVSLGDATPTETPLQTATTKSSALNNIIDLCSGKKATAPFSNAKFCVCANVLDTIYNYAADEIYFSLPIYSLYVLDGSSGCRKENYNHQTSLSSTGPLMPLLGNAYYPPQQVLPSFSDESSTNLMHNKSPGHYHTVDFTCGFINQGFGPVSLCSQIAQLCASAIIRYQLITAAFKNAGDSPTTGYINVLPYTEHGCGQKFNSQLSIRCTIPCKHTL